MLKDRGMRSLALFYTMYFIALGLTTYAGKYYGEIGLTDDKIGLIGAVPAFVALFAQPLWGILSDRVAQKKIILVVALLMASGIALLVRPASGAFLSLLLVLTLLNTATLPVLPVGNAIAIEYTREVGHDYGPVRMMGTVGFQISILVAGFVFTGSLKNMYAAYGALLVVTALFAMRLPPVKGYQHGNKRESFTVFFRDRKLILLFSLVFIAETASQFYLTFFSKHLGDLNVPNSVIGVITVLSVALEVPFLLFGDKLHRKMPIWKWLWIGLFCNGVRFVLLSVVRNPILIVLVQSPSVTLFACFEFFPAVYLGESVQKELRGSAQNAFQLVAFGVSRIVGTLLGGLIAGHLGITAVFGLNGVLLLIAAAVMYLPLRRMWRANA